MSMATPPPDLEPDETLRRALEHAPDRHIGAPPAIGEILRRQARAATGAPPRSGRVHAALTRAWRALTATGSAAPWAGALGSLAVAGLVLMLWSDAWRAGAPGPVQEDGAAVREAAPPRPVAEEPAPLGSVRTRRAVEQPETRTVDEAADQAAAPPVAQTAPAPRTPAADARPAPALPATRAEPARQAPAQPRAGGRMPVPRAEAEQSAAPEPPRATESMADAPIAARDGKRASAAPAPITRAEPADTPPQAVPPPKGLAAAPPPAPAAAADRLAATGKEARAPADPLAPVLAALADAPADSPAWHQAERLRRLQRQSTGRWQPAPSSLPEGQGDLIRDAQGAPLGRLLRTPQGLHWQPHMGPGWVADLSER